MRQESEGLLGNILSERLTTSPDITVVVDTETIEAVARVRAEFESYNPEKGMSSHQTSILTPEFAYDFRVRFGAGMPDENELYMLMSQKRNGDRFKYLSKGEIMAAGQCFNKLGRNGVATVGALREEDLAALFHNPTLHTPIRTLVFAQTAVKKFDRLSQ